jgi:hypothetical protein
MAMKRRNLAVDFLLEMLGEGQALPAHVITQEAAARTISSRTLARAKTALRVQSRKLAADWVWVLPRETTAKDATKDAIKDNSVTAVTDTPTPPPAIPAASGNPEIPLDGAPPDMERLEGVGETQPRLPSSLTPVSDTVEEDEDPATGPLINPSPHVGQHEVLPVGGVCGDFDLDVNPGPPTAVEQAVFRLLDPNHPPIKFTGRQWRQLVVDARRAHDDGWLHRAVVAGWRLEDLIDRRRGRGLLVAIEGGTIVRVENGSATIRSEDGDQWVYRRPSGSA